MHDHYHLNIPLEHLSSETLQAIREDLNVRWLDLWKRVEQGPADPDTDRAIVDELSELDEQILKLKLEMAWRKQ